MLPNNKIWYPIVDVDSSLYECNIQNLKFQMPDLYDDNIQNMIFNVDDCWNKLKLEKVDDLDKIEKMLNYNTTK